MISAPASPAKGLPHERRAVVYDNKGNGLVFYSPLQR